MRDEALKRLANAARTGMISKNMLAWISTDVGAYDPVTGSVSVGMKRRSSDDDLCAEDLARIKLEEMGVEDSSRIRYSTAIRPRTGEVVDVCV